MMKFKRICCLVWVFVCINTLCAYAEPVQVSFDAQSTDYHESLEVYLSNENSYYCFKLGPDNAYDLSLEVKEGTYTVHAFSIGDANRYYSYRINPEKLTVKQGESNQVMVRLLEQESEAEAGDNSLPPDTTEPALEPAVYDFTDGDTACGTLEVECSYISGAKSVVYLLCDENGNEYPISLNADNMYSAIALLPYGTYHETGRPTITFFEDCEVSKDYRYTWIHTDSGYFGDYFTLNADNSTITTDDLAVVLHHNGASYFSPDFWELSITKKYYDNIVEHITAIDQSVNADEYEDINRYLEKAGRETIPEVPDTIEITAGKDDDWPHSLIAAALLIGICLTTLFLFALYRRTQKNPKY